MNERSPSMWISPRGSELNGDRLYTIKYQRSGASAHSTMEYLIDALLKECKRGRSPIQITFQVDTRIIFEGGATSELSRKIPLSQEGQDNVWRRLQERLRPAKETKKKR